MFSKSDNVKILINDEAIEVIKELFNSLKVSYQNNLELIKGSEFVFDYPHLLYFKCDKVIPDCGGSYVDSLYWIKNGTINPINRKYHKSFQYAVIVTLNQEEIKKDLQRTTKIKPFLNKYNWKGINFPSEKIIPKI